MSSPRVSIVVVNWNRADDVIACVRHLETLRGENPSFEVIVVDNGSTDGSPERLAELPGVRLIRSAENLGPARGRNLGIEAAAGDYLFFVDSDALIGRRTLAHLVARMDRDPKVGIAGCRILRRCSRTLDQWIYAEPAATHARLEFETYSFSAAGAMMRTDAIRAVGGFWSELFIYNEEVDLSIRVIRAGYSILYVPKARVFHFPSLQGRKGASSYWYYQIRNWIWIFYRYYPVGERRRKVALYSAVYLVKGTLNRQLAACWSGIRAGLRETELIARFEDKLTQDELRRLASLNRRRSLRASR